MQYRPQYDIISHILLIIYVLSWEGGVVVVVPAHLTFLEIQSKVPSENRESESD